MSTYHYLVCREHMSVCASHKNAGLPMCEAYVMSTWLYEHFDCPIKQLDEHAIHGEGYRYWRESDATEKLK